MPYNITRAQAIDIASANVSRRYVEVDADICFNRKMRDGTHLDLYLWVVHFYYVPRDSRSGSATRILVDPISGEILSADEIGWSSIS